MKSRIVLVEHCGLQREVGKVRFCGLHTTTSLLRDASATLLAGWKIPRQFQPARASVSLKTLELFLGGHIRYLIRRTLGHLLGLIGLGASNRRQCQVQIRSSSKRIIRAALSMGRYPTAGPFFLAGAGLLVQTSVESSSSSSQHDSTTASKVTCE